MDLAGYEHAKFELSGLLQTIINDKLTDENRLLQDRLQDLLVRLAEDRFYLVVAGRFSRGKSSLMNAILRLDRLPTGIVPLTSVITTVSYGTLERVIIKYRQRRLDSEITLKELPQYVTQEGNPGNSRGIATANIELPADILRRGFVFVDTPGLGSAIAENTATTNAFLLEADALLLVTSFESPLSEDELAVLRRASRADLPVFVALNKHDLVTRQERERAVAFVRECLRPPENAAVQGMFSVSARDGLAGALSGDCAQLQESGVPAIEDELIRFLLEQKRAVFLVRMGTRVTELIDDLPDSERRADLRQQIMAFMAKQRSNIASRPQAQSNNSPAGRLHSARLEACEICTAVEARAWNFLTRFQYEIATDRQCQDDFSRRSGFCCYHTMEYQKLASPFGTCSGYPALLERLADALRRISQTHDTEMASALEALLPHHETCPMCSVRDQAEARAIADVSERLRHDIVERERLSALCLPHLLAVARSLDDGEAVRPLLQQQALILERTAEDMRRFTLKQSAARRQLQTKEEQTASARGLALVAGRRNVNFAVGHGVERTLDLFRHGIRLAHENRS